MGTVKFPKKNFWADNIGDSECSLDHTPNVATIAAMQEVQDIIDGKIKAKSYKSAAELSRELDAEYEAETAGGIDV
jgi:hypothetical protein